MAPRGEYLIAHLMDQPTEEFKQWPRHLTLVPWFEISDTEQLCSDIEVVAAEFSPLVLSVRGLSQVTSRSKPQNQILEKTIELQQLHNSLVGTIQSGGTIRNLGEIGANFEPKVRIKGAKPLRPGGKVTVEHFSLIQALESKETRNRTKRLVKTFALTW